MNMLDYTLVGARPLYLSCFCIEHIFWASKLMSKSHICWSKSGELDHGKRSDDFPDDDFSQLQTESPRVSRSTSKAEALKEATPRENDESIHHVDLQRMGSENWRRKNVEQP